MKLLKYLPLIALPALVASCTEDPAIPPIVPPHSDWTANTTVLALKQAYWQAGVADYVTEVGKNPMGEDIIVRGRVISSDAAGNVYKALYIADETGAITVSLNQNQIYNTYHYGQEVAINVTGLKIGGYNNLMQIGAADGAKMGRLDSDLFAEHCQQASLPRPEEVVPVATDLLTINEAKASVEGLQQWQGLLVTIDGLTFENPGVPFAPGESSSNRYMKDAAGNRINLRCSNYATFAQTPIPAGTGSVTAILSYFGSDWQLLLNNLDGLKGFEGIDTPDTPDTPAQEANTSIIDLKKAYWQAGVANYVTEVGQTDSGEDIVIRGRVISSDASGNIFKTLYVADATGAIAVALNDKAINQAYKYGQEVSINVTGLKIGGYNNLMQIGEGDGEMMGRVEPGVFAQHCKTVSAPQPEAVVPVETDIATLMAAKTTPEGLQQWQGLLVTVKGLTFEDAGAAFAPDANTNRYMKDAAGNSLNLRCSSYATFAKDIIPAGTGNVTAILSYYGSDWQLLLNDLGGLQGFDGSTAPDVPDTPVAGGAWSRASAVTSGSAYIIWAAGKSAKAVATDKDYSWLYVTDCTPAADGSITADAKNAYTFTQEAKGYTIKSADGVYLYMQGTFNSFQLSKSLDAANDNFYWTVDPGTDGTFKVTNLGTGKTMQYSAQHSSWGAYADLTTGPFVTLYQQKAK